MPIIIEKHKWDRLIETLPMEAAALASMAKRISEDITHIQAMLASKSELKSVEENLTVMKLGMDIEVLIQTYIALVRKYSRPEDKEYVTKLENDLRTILQDIKEDQQKGTFSATAQGTASYVIKVATILNQIYDVLYFTKKLWLQKLNVRDIPRTQILREATNAVSRYLSLLRDIANDVKAYISSPLPKENPEQILSEFIQYLMLEPTRFIPARAYYHLLDKEFLKKENQVFLELLIYFLNDEYAPYHVELPTESYEQNIIASYAESALAEILLFDSSMLQIRISSIPVEEIFYDIAKYPPKDIEEAILITKDPQHQKMFWDIFVKQAILRAGVHVSVEEEEEEKGKKKKKTQERTVIEQPIELSPELEKEIESLLAGESE